MTGRPLSYARSDARLRLVSKLACKYEGELSKAKGSPETALWIADLWISVGTAT
jgi:hypothetical protein